MKKCYFCHDLRHKSWKCNKYATNEARKRIADKEKFCRFCFIKVPRPQEKEGCESNAEFNGWHSKDDHTMFCPDRVIALTQNLFFPKIDEDLWQRFFNIFELEEQHALRLSSKKAQKYVPFKNIKLIDEYHNAPERSLNSDEVLIVTHAIDFSNLDKSILFYKIALKKVIWKVRVVKIRKTKISEQELLQIIGSYTKEIEMEKINSNITFAEIIKNAPNIEVLKIFDKWLKINEETWLEDLYKYKEGKNFRELFIHLNTIEFNIETLKKFVKTKSVSGIIIKIRYENREKRKAFHQFADKMSKIFIEDNYPEDDEAPYINLEFDGLGDFKCFTLDMNKNDGPPLKKRKKRN